MGNKMWTAEEDTILAANWTNGEHIRMWCDLLPNRTYRAIHQRGMEKYGARGRTYTSGNSVTWRAIQRVLADGAMKSALQIAQLTGLDRNWISRELRDHYPHAVHIGGYGPRPANGFCPRLWTLGAGKDAPKPVAMTHAEVSRRRWKRLKKERPEVIDARNARRKLRKLEEDGLLIRRDIAASWI